jgi:alpha-D-ribose 1-methylphosphonate 5-triphosphate synthase subunit PhnH
MTAVLRNGFAAPVFDSQADFRALMEATAYAGRIVPLPRLPGGPEGLYPASVALLLTLADLDTVLWLDEAAALPEALAFLRFHCGAPAAREHQDADFALIARPLVMPRLASFKAGEPEYPDRSATLIIEVPSFTSGRPTRWTGPGIETEREVAIDGLADGFWEEWTLNRLLYPMGIDIFFTCADALVALPRSIDVER